MELILENWRKFLTEIIISYSGKKRIICYKTQLADVIGHYKSL